MSPSLVTKVYEAIIRRILDRVYHPGDPINRRDVAQNLDVSLSPVSEAFAILQSEEIIVTVPRKGTFISKLDWRELGDLINVRAALESEAARRYCGAVLKTNLPALTARARRVEGCRPLSYEQLAADIDFHRSLVRLANNQWLSKLFDQLITRCLLLALEATMNLLIDPDKTVSHTRFLQDLSKASPDAAGELIREHLFAGKERVLSTGTGEINAGFEGLQQPGSHRTQRSLDLILGHL